jgi:hypothetical protein
LKLELVHLQLVLENGSMMMINKLTGLRCRVPSFDSHTGRWTPNKLKNVNCISPQLFHAFSEYLDARILAWISQNIMIFYILSELINRVGLSQEVLLSEEWWFGWQLVEHRATALGKHRPGVNPCLLAMSRMSTTSQACYILYISR